MIEIWQDCTSFQTTNQKFADHVRTIIMKSWFYDLEIRLKQIMNQTLIQYRTHQVLTNKNSLTEMNQKLLKIYT